jgi:hypothetical protein
MSYATMLDVSFALKLADRELRDQPSEHANKPAAEPELPKQPEKAPDAIKRESKRETHRKPASAKRAA